MLADPVTSVRRAALVEHVGFILDQLEAVHRLQDEALWPAVLTHRPHLADLADGARRRPTPDSPIQSNWSRHAALTWKRAPITRTAARTAVRDLAAAVEPVAGQDAETVPLACAMLPDDALARSSGPIPGRSDPPRSPAGCSGCSTICRRPRPSCCWRRHRAWALWVLRNGFSGAYNRAAYLMWIGGGNGPAV